MTGEFKKSTLREYFESIVIAVILALFIRTFVVQAFKIPTGSMEENLLIGDHLLVNKFVFGPTGSALERSVLPVRDVRRRDVIVFKYPDQPERDFIKRVIGLPGDTVEIKQGVTYVNGKALVEPYVQLTEQQKKHMQAFDPYTVPEGDLFVLGDNRLNSNDSRFELGPVPMDKVIGKAFVTIWPPSRLGWLH